MICFLGQDLWGHVEACTPRTMKETISTTAFNSIRQAKVGKLDSLLIVQEQVFDLDVSMKNALAVHVMNTSN